MNFTEDGPANAACRPLDRGWRERHIRWQAEGRIPLGKMPLLHVDGTPVRDRLGRQRWWSMHVEAATQLSRPTSRAIAKMKARAEEQSRVAEAGRALLAQVQKGIRPPQGKAFAVDVGARLLIGPNGAVGSSERLVRTLESLAAGGRHAAAVLVAAGAWRDEQALREALTGIGGKLAAVGLGLDRRKTGIRLAKERT